MNELYISKVSAHREELFQLQSISLIRKMKRWLASFVSEQQRLRLSELKDKKSIKNVPFKFGIFRDKFVNIIINDQS